MVLRGLFIPTSIRPARLAVLFPSFMLSGPSSMDMSFAMKIGVYIHHTDLATLGKDKDCDNRLYYHESDSDQKQREGRR
jgi:hypothetical protein